VGGLRTSTPPSRPSALNGYCTRLDRATGRTQERTLKHAQPLGSTARRGGWVCGSVLVSRGLTLTAVAPIRHVFVLMLENQNAAVTFLGPASLALSRADVAGHAERCCPTTMASVHASLDNYIALISGPGAE